MKCENEVALKIDWANGKLYEIPCTNDATKMIIDGFGFGHLCDECSERIIASKHLTLNMETSINEIDQKRI